MRRVISGDTLTGPQAGLEPVGHSTQPATQKRGGLAWGAAVKRRKHTKIARELKYDTYNVNFGALEKELGHPDEDAYVDKWADDYPDED